MRRRHWLYATVGLLLLLVNVYAFWPFVEAGRDMDRFCDQLPAGATLDRVRALAAEQGYLASAEPNGRVVVEDPRSAGRRSCTLQFGVAPKATAAASSAASS